MPGTDCDIPAAVPPVARIYASCCITTRSNSSLGSLVIRRIVCRARHVTSMFELNKLSPYFCACYWSFGRLGKCNAAIKRLSALIRVFMRSASLISLFPRELGRCSTLSIFDRPDLRPG